MLKKLKRFRPLLIAYVALRSAQARKRYESGDIASIGGATTVHRPLSESVAYIRQVFSDFNHYAHLSPERVEGMRMAEIGPGDNLGVGLLYLAWGAASYTGLDRFYSSHDLEREREIYLALRKDLSAEERARVDDSVDLSSSIRFNESKIRYRYGISAEDCDRTLGPETVDILLSRVVVQSVNLDLAFPAMHHVLAPGGLMAHKIDFRDLGVFVRNGFHALEFRTLSESTYQWMIQGGDHPNRRHVPYYENFLSRHNYSFQIWRTGIIDPSPPDFWKPIDPHVETLVEGVHFGPEHVDWVNNIRPRLIPEFRSLPAADLLAAGIFLVATKPAAS